jgi:hypothetical protein
VLRAGQERQNSLDAFDICRKSVAANLDLDVYVAEIQQSTDFVA